MATRKTAAPKAATKSAPGRQPKPVAPPAAAVSRGALLDKNRPYGEVWGTHFAKYEQDGKLFDAHGKQVFEPGTEPEAEPVTEAPVAEPAAVVAAVAMAADAGHAEEVDEAALVQLSQGGEGD